MERLGASDLPAEPVEKVEQPDIDFPDLSRAVVSEDIIDLLESFGLEFSRTKVSCGQGFSGMSVVQGEAFRVE